MNGFLDRYFWDEVSGAHDAHQRLASVTRGKITAAQYWPMLAGAISETDFANRLEVISKRLEALIDPEVYEDVISSLYGDYRAVHEASEKASLACGHAECVNGLPCKREDPDYWDKARGEQKQSSQKTATDYKPDPDQAWRYHQEYEQLREPVNNGALMDSDGFVADLAQNEHRDVDRMNFQLTPGEWHNTPGTAMPERPMPFSQERGFVPVAAHPNTDLRMGSVQHTAPGGGEHAPYKIEKGDGGYYVVNEKGERKNKDPKSHDEARQFQKALYKNVPGASESAKHGVINPLFKYPAGDVPLSHVISDEFNDQVDHARAMGDFHGYHGRPVNDEGQEYADYANKHPNSAGTQFYNQGYREGDDRKERELALAEKYRFSEGHSNTASLDNTERWNDKDYDKPYFDWALSQGEPTATEASGHRGYQHGVYDRERDHSHQGDKRLESSTGFEADNKKRQKSYLRGYDTGYRPPDHPVQNRFGSRSASNRFVDSDGFFVEASDVAQEGVGGRANTPLVDPAVGQPVKVNPFYFNTEDAAMGSNEGFPSAPTSDPVDRINEIYGETAPASSVQDTSNSVDGDGYSRSQPGQSPDFNQSAGKRTSSRHEAWVQDAITWGAGIGTGTLPVTLGPAIDAAEKATGARAHRQGHDEGFRDAINNRPPKVTEGGEGLHFYHHRYNSGYGEGYDKGTAGRDRVRPQAGYHDTRPDRRVDGPDYDDSDIDGPSTADEYDRPDHSIKGPDDSPWSMSQDQLRERVERTWREKHKTSNRFVGDGEKTYPLTCTTPGCGKTFWSGTPMSEAFNQHVQEHVNDYGWDHGDIEHYDAPHPMEQYRHASTDGKIVAQCAGCGDALRKHTTPHGDELHHLKNDHVRCHGARKSATMDPNDPLSTPDATMSGDQAQSAVDPNLGQANSNGNPTEDQTMRPMIASTQFFDPTLASHQWGSNINGEESPYNFQDAVTYTQGYGTTLSHDPLFSLAGSADPQLSNGTVHMAGDYLGRPDATNPTGRGQDEYRANTWDAYRTTRPMQDERDRGVNTPQTAGDPIRVGPSINTPQKGLQTTRPEDDEEEDDEE